jgi:excisionase family DNA binding protein
MYKSTTEDAANEFNVSLSTIRKWVKAGIIPRKAYLKAGTTYRFNLTLIYEALLREPEEKEPVWNSLVTTTTDSELIAAMPPSEKGRVIELPDRDPTPTWQAELADAAEAEGEENILAKTLEQWDNSESDEA